MLRNPKTWFAAGLVLWLSMTVRSNARAMQTSLCPSPEPCVCQSIPIPPYGTFEWYGIPMP